MDSAHYETAMQRYSDTFFRNLAILWAAEATLASELASRRTVEAMALIDLVQARQVEDVEEAFQALVDTDPTDLAPDAAEIASMLRSCCDSDTSQERV